jgi:hypothetical protein
MAIDTEAASFAALTVDPRRITIGRISNTAFGVALTSANETGASVVLVVVDEIETEVEVVVKVDVTVVGGTVVGATVVGGTVVGATVVGATVVGATVVVGTTLRVEIAVAVETFDCEPIPS